MVRVRHPAALLVLLATKAVSAGEIAGLMTPLPPHVGQDAGLVFSNDFLGRGGSVDDFRTQQVILSARLSDRWSALLDHSILTLSSGSDVGRIDQLAASFGYDFFRRELPDRQDRVVTGFGARGKGSFAGERIQNGFHRLIGSTLEALPYTSSRGVDATAWVDASHYRLFSEAGDGRLLRSWRTGASFRAASLVTTDGQWDSTVSALAVASRPSIDVWLGVRADWREGYDDIVLAETARAESDVALVFGARYGALVIETVQQLNNDASYGQLRLVSTGRRNGALEVYRPRIALDFGISMPDVLIRVAGRCPACLADPVGSPWKRSVVVVAAYGEPQYEDNNRLYVRSGQLDVGLEFERPWAGAGEWLTMYAVTTAGWREQTLLAVNEAQEERSGSVGRAVLTAGGGVRVHAAGPARGWRLSIHAGLFALFPLADADLEIGGEVIDVQRPALNALLGFTLAYE